MIDEEVIKDTLNRRKYDENDAQVQRLMPNGHTTIFGNNVDFGLLLEPDTFDCRSNDYPEYGRFLNRYHVKRTQTDTRSEYMEREMNLASGVFLKIYDDIQSGATYMLYRAIDLPAGVGVSLAPHLCNDSNAEAAYPFVLDLATQMQSQLT